MTLSSELQEKCKGKLKFCIWDVGKVIYDFSFCPLE